MTNPAWPSPVDPNNQTNDPTNYANDQQIQQDTNQWIQDKQAMAADATDIANALLELEKALKSGKPDAVFTAMMTFFMQIFPDILKYQQDNMNMLADAQNISSDLRGFVNSIQNDFNEGGSTPASVLDLYNNTTDLKSWTTFLSTAQPGLWDASDAPLDPTDAQSITGDVDSIESNFYSGSGPTQDWGQLGQMQTDMQTWFAPPPSTGTPSDPFPQVKAIQAALQQANASVSTLATTTQTTEQFYTNQYNQLTGIDNSMQQNTASELTSFVNNQKTS